MLRIKRFLSIFLSVVLVLGLVVAPSMSYAQEDSVTLTIVHTNDIHGNASDDGSTIGFARLKSIVEDLRADNPNLILLDAGDTIHGTNFATLAEGESMINIMNEVGYDAMAPGNHDFNYGSERLVELDEEVAEFPILGANVVYEEGGENLLDSFEIITLENGLAVGIFGLGTEETKVKSHPNNTEGIEFADPIAVSEAMVEDLEELGVDLIVAVTHIGLDEESDPTTRDIAEAVDGIDVIVDGHSHTLLEEGMVVGDTLIVQANEHMKYIGVVEIEITEDMVNKDVRLINYEQSQAYDEDPDILSFIKGIEDENNEVLQRVIGETSTVLDGERENVRAGETNLGNLITDAMVAYTGADVALTNGGGIRDSIQAGDITVDDVMTVLPFVNYPMVIEVTGETIIAALEFGTADYPNPAGGFPHVAGMSYEINTLAPQGRRVQNVLVDGEPIDLNETYNLVTNDFMASGGDGYEMFGDAPVIEEFEYALLSEVLMEFIEVDLEGIVDYEVEGRITAVEKSILNKEGNPAYIHGYGDETVRPNGFMTREGAASVFYRLLMEEFKERVETTEHSFTDVAKDRWSNDAIATLANANILAGYGDETFKPGGYITRAEVVKIASQFERLNTVDGNDFVDINNGHWAKDAINSAADKGWIIGYLDQTFRPNQHMTRAEFVTLVNKVLEREVDLDNLPEDAIEFPDLNESSWYYGDMMMAINSF